MMNLNLEGRGGGAGYEYEQLDMIPVVGNGKEKKIEMLGRILALVDR